MPSNIDTSMLSLSTGASSVSDKDKDFTRIYNKIRDVMGPLSTAWNNIKMFRSGENNSPVDVDAMAELVQKSIILLGQAGNAVSYQRRISVLSKFIEAKKAKGLIRDQS